VAYSLTWSKDGSYLLAQAAGDVRLYSASGSKIDPKIVNDIAFTGAFWDTQRDSIVYIEAQYPDQASSQIVYEIDLKKSTISPITYPAETIGVVNGSAFQIKQSFATSILTVVRSENEQELVRLPRSTYTLIDIEDPNLVLMDQQGDFYLVNPSNGDVIEIPAHSTNYSWDAQGNRFAYANDTELHIVSPQQRQSDLLLRLTNGVSHIAWHPSGQRLLYSTNTTLEAIDGYQYTFVRDRATLATLEQIDNFWIDARGKYIYILGTQSGTRHIYSLRIK
jgi:sugar lactone lactonase YvrE